MTKKEFKFSNGDEVEEIITGLKGVITGTAYYLTGCNTYLVTVKPKDEFSEPVAVWYDEGRLRIRKQATFTEENVSSIDPGCDKLPNVGKKGM